jgi:hypothetical protein
MELNGNRRDLEMDESKIIRHVQNKKVVNSIRQLCRELNNVPTSKFCQWRTFFGRDAEGNLMNGGNMQVKHCKLRACKINYHKLIRKVKSMAKRGLLQIERRYFIDTDIYNKFVWNKRKDRFYFIFLDYEEFRKRILVNTLDAYV